jgi:hypothetical protein
MPPEKKNAGKPEKRVCSKERYTMSHSVASTLKASFPPLIKQYSFKRQVAWWRVGSGHEAGQK